MIARGERGLVALPEAVASTVRVASTWRVSDLRKPVRLEVVTTFEGARAVGMRHTLAQDGVSEVQRRYLEHYAKRDPGIALASPLEVEDAPDADRVTTRERYDLSARGANEELELVADVVLAELTVPETALRKQPLRIEHPVAVEERVRVELPWAPKIAREEVEVKGRAAQLTRKGWPEGNAYVMEYRYRTLAPSIAAAAVPGHLAKLREMREEAVRALPVGPSRVPGAPFAGAKLAVMGAALAAVLAVGYVLYSTSSAGLRAWWSALVRWRRRHAWHAKLHEDPGDAPHVATPVRLPGSDRLRLPVLSLLLPSVLPLLVVAIAVRVAAGLRWELIAGSVMVGLAMAVLYAARPSLSLGAAYKRGLMPMFILVLAVDFLVTYADSMAGYELAAALSGAERVPSRWIPAAVVTVGAMLEAVILNTAWTFVVVLSARRLTHRLGGAPTIGSSS